MTDTACVIVCMCVSLFCLCISTVLVNSLLRFFIKIFSQLKLTTAQVMYIQHEKWAETKIKIMKVHVILNATIVFSFVQ